MNRTLRITAVVAAAAMVAALAPAAAQETASTSAYVSAQIIAPLEVTRLADLTFGTMVAPEVTTNLRLSPMGERTDPGPVPADAEPADFVVSGQPGMTYRIVLSEQVHLSGGAFLTEDLMVDEFASDIGDIGTLDETGSSAFLVGATLHLEPGVAPGKYVGSFDVTVAYE